MSNPIMNSITAEFRAPKQRATVEYRIKVAYSGGGKYTTYHQRVDNDVCYQGKFEQTFEEAMEDFNDRVLHCISMSPSVYEESALSKSML